MTELLDASALIALLRDEPGAADVQDVLRRGESVVVAINLSEALDRVMRVDGVDAATLRTVISPLLATGMAVRSIDEPLAWAAAELRARRYHRTRAPLSLADCALVAAAQPGDAVVSADGALLRVARAEGVDVVVLPDSRGRRARM